jgi:hypothetical protein
MHRYREVAEVEILQVRSGGGVVDTFPALPSGMPS